MIIDNHHVEEGNRRTFIETLNVSWQHILIMQSFKIMTSWHIPKSQVFYAPLLPSVGRLV